MDESLEPILTHFAYGDVDRRKPRRLPHWHAPNGIQFVTWRLHDSLPRHVAERLEALKQTETRKRVSAGVVSDAHDGAWFDEVDRELDRGLGACYMRNPHVADIVQEAIFFFDRDRYRVIAWSIMPSHVHVILRILGDRVLWDIVQSWKKYSAGEANRFLGRTGRFWQKGYFDRLIRDSGELARRIRYVVDNPRTAGLKEWRWAGFDPEAIREILQPVPRRVDLRSTSHERSE